MTQTTPAGRQTGAALFGDRVVQAYLPYDLPCSVRRFLARTQPQLGVVLETEVWPNLLAAYGGRGGPVYLVNARWSERSARGYARFGRVTRASLSCFRGIAAQAAANAEGLERLGASGIIVAGNLNFDAPPPPDTAAKAAEPQTAHDACFVFLAASTRESEEDLLLVALAALQLPDLLLAIVPPHPPSASSRWHV